MSSHAYRYSPDAASTPAQSGAHVPFCPRLHDPSCTTDEAAARVVGLRWWGAYVDGAQNSEENFRVRLFETEPNGPAVGNFVTLHLGPAHERRPAAFYPNGAAAVNTRVQAYEYHVRLFELGLSADFVYWLAIDNMAPGDISWLWYPKADCRESALQSVARRKGLQFRAFAFEFANARAADEA